MERGTGDLETTFYGVVGSAGRKWPMARQHVHSTYVSFFVASCVALFVVLSAVSVIPGCQGGYTYRIRGMIKSAIDGAVLPGVAVTCSDAAYSSEGQPVLSGSDGSFSLE